MFSREGKHYRYISNVVLRRLASALLNCWWKAAQYQPHSELPRLIDFSGARTPGSHTGQYALCCVARVCVSVAFFNGSWIFARPFPGNAVAFTFGPAQKCALAGTWAAGGSCSWACWQPARPAVRPKLWWAAIAGGHWVCSIGTSTPGRATCWFAAPTLDARRLTCRVQTASSAA